MNANAETNAGLSACALVIDTLEAELCNARALRTRYVGGELDAADMRPVRHFCAGLVETALELARRVAEVSPTP